MNNIGLIILLLLSVCAVLTVVFLSLFGFLKRQILSDIKNNQEQFFKIIEQQTKGEKELVDNSISGLEKQLKEYQILVHKLEQDRAEKYGNLDSAIKNASQTTQKLQDSTNRLNDILGNVKLRGQWGERMAEDIISFSGLIEGVNYRKQKQLTTTGTKPDYTFILPDDHIVNMDVKFPLNNYTKMFDTASEMERESYEKEFFKNVKTRIKEIQSRDYINPAERTLDFVMLFIPNEQVFSFIQEKEPALMDEALRQKVVLCSPFTLYAMLSVVRQAFENFRYEKDLKKIIYSIEQFSKTYEIFKKRFEKIGSGISELNKTYEEVKDTSFKQLDTKIKNIDQYKTGQKLTSTTTNELTDVSENDSEEDAVL